MKKGLHLLRDTDIKNARSPKKGRPPLRLYDGGNLVCVIPHNGRKRWEFAYTRPITKKRNNISLGAAGQAATYPEITLAAARDMAFELRRLLQQGIDPADAKLSAFEVGRDTFERFAREWLLKQSPRWTSGYSGQVKTRLEKHVFPWIGKTPIQDVSVGVIKSVLDRIEQAGHFDTAERVRGYCSKIFRLAIASGKASFDPADVVSDAMAKRPKTSHHPAITDPEMLAELLRKVDAYSGNFIVTSLLRLAPLVFLRPGELRFAEWSEIDLERGEWSLPEERMKMRLPHTVPLSLQAISILKDLYPLTGHGRFVFPGHKGASVISDNTPNKALASLGYKGQQTLHGFRATARTILDEVLNERPDHIEHQLAHAVRDANGRAYNRTTFIHQRLQMMQRWADYLDQLKLGHNNIHALKRAA